MTLELRPGCECCDVDLPPASLEVYVCTFECTFCLTCCRTKLNFVCPNCGGELVRRPVRPAALLAKYPPATKRTFKSAGCQ